MQDMAEIFIAFRKSLTDESDRGCALFSSAYIDSLLGDLFRRKLVYSKSLERDVLKGGSPLSTFSARIKMAYYIGLISEEMRKKLDIIRDVRNDFAHHPVTISFEEQSVRDRCDLPPG